MPILELTIPQVRQRKAYTCGPAAMLSCLRYLRVAGKATEASLAREMGTTPAGTSDAPMVAAARTRVSRAEARTGVTIGELAIHARRGDVCILSLQAWTERPEVPYRDELGQGHYVVLTAVTATHVYVMDPALPRVRARLTHAELEERWHDAEDDRVIHGWAIVVEGPEPRLRPLRRSKRMG